MGRIVPPAPVDSLPPGFTLMSRLILSATLFGLFLSVSQFASISQAQKFVANYDESKIPSFTLPDPLVTEKGDSVTDAKTWFEVRRPEILDLFAAQVYGRAPEPCDVRHQEVSQTKVFGGKATRREVDVILGDDALSIRVLIYTPTSAKPAPAFVTLNFQGNHSVDPDPSISLNESWMRPKKETTQNNRATEKARGVASSRWPIEMIIDRGYALVTIYYGDIDPDFDDGFENGVHGALKADVAKAKIPAGEKWGSIAGWAYGVSRVVDYLETDQWIDSDRLAVMGHSRLGKTSLWTGATDTRFKLVISNNSGCGGAALSRRAIGETVGRINTVFPHWFCDNYLQYNLNEDGCPVDQHQLIALIAPRAVYIASATEDRWADPKGEFLSAVHADPVYRLLGTVGFGGSAPPEMPAPDNAIKTGKIGYHLRTGKHNVTSYDWTQYLDFADIHLQ